MVKERRALKQEKKQAAREAKAAGATLPEDMVENEDEAAATAAPSEAPGDS